MSNDVILVPPLEGGRGIYCLYEREGKPAAAAWATGDTGDYYEVVLGVLKPPSDRFSGYEKRTVQLFVQDHQKFTVSAT